MNPENSARAERALFALRSYLRAKDEEFAHEDLDAGHRALPAQQHLVATDLPIELHPGSA